MVEASSQQGSTSKRWFGSLAWVLVIAAACVASGVVTFLFHLSRPAEPRAAVTTEVRESPSVIVALRDLATLETASAHIERVIDLRDRQTRLFGLVESEDALLLVAAADVIAGFDLGELRDEDVKIDAEKAHVEILLPPVRVLSARLDNQRTYVHSRQTGALAERAESLETRARVEAEKTLRQAALDAGLLARGQASAERTISSLVHSLGYRSVSVRFRDE
jgi:Flp pilus assembly protein CpaB